VDTKPFTGVVEYFDDRKGEGLIRAEEGKLVKFGAQSIMGRALRTACTGEYVKGQLFLKVSTKEWRAAEVIFTSQDGSPEKKDPTLERQETKVTAFGPHRDFYELQSIKHKRIILQRSKILRSFPVALQFGDKISCIVVPTRIGYQAILPPEAESELVRIGQLDKSGDYYFIQAILALNRNQYDDARRFFQEGIRVAPSQDLYSSYATMEKERGESQMAIKILREAVERYPNDGQFYKELGQLLYENREYADSITALANGLNRAPKYPDLHRLLARSLFAEGTEDNLKKALLEYEETKKLGLLSPEDNSTYNELKVQLQNPRGRRILKFLREADLSLVESAFYGDPPHAVDLIVSPSITEYIETYDLHGYLYFRCYFENVVKPEDIGQLLKNESHLADKAGVNPDVRFIIIHSTDSIREYLYRLNDELFHATVVPIDETTLDGGVQGFRGVLDDWLFRRDLYDFRFPVSGRRFFGREEEIKQIDDAIEDNEWVGVFGLRKIGKTSLIEEIARRRNRDIIARCDMLTQASIPSCVFLLVEIARLFDEQLRTKFEPTYKSVIRKLKLLPKTTTIGDKIEIADISLKFDHDMAIIFSAFKAAHRQVPRFLLILDEVERLLPMYNQPGIVGFDTFLSYLRGQSQKLKRLSLVIVGANPMVSERPTWDHIDNPLFEFVKVIYLPPLRYEECSKMARDLGRGMGIEYDDDALESLYEQTGGHPYITRQYCSFISKRIRNRPLRISRFIFEQNIDPFIFASSNIFQEILERLRRDYPDEQVLLEFIADGVTSEKVLVGLLKGPCQLSLQHLVGYQLITRQENGDYIVRIGLLRRWILRNWLGK